MQPPRCPAASHAYRIRLANQRTGDALELGIRKRRLMALRSLYIAAASWDSCSKTATASPLRNHTVAPGGSQSGGVGTGESAPAGETCPITGLRAAWEPRLDTQRTRWLRICRACSTSAGRPLLLPAALLDGHDAGGLLCPSPLARPLARRIRRAARRECAEPSWPNCAGGNCCKGRQWALFKGA